jgi:hypothetical protein
MIRSFGITAEGLADFIQMLEVSATMIDDVPHVSRDNDLLSLGDPATAEGREFAARFPGLEILTPPQLLARIASPS